MSLYVILGLLVCIEAQGPPAVTPVFVQKGRDLLLKFDAVLQEFSFIEWKFNNIVNLVRFEPAGQHLIYENFTGRLEFPEVDFAVILKNVQEADSGVYSAKLVTILKDQTLAEYKVTVQGPVSPVELTMDSNSSESCDLHVTCRTHDSHISSTFRVDRLCSQEGGERSEVTTSGASLQVYLLHNRIICNHSNHVHWTDAFITAEHLCFSNGFVFPSVFLVKIVVFSVGLIIMVSAVITVHLVDFKKHQ